MANIMVAKIKMYFMATSLCYCFFRSL